MWILAMACTGPLVQLQVTENVNNRFSAIVSVVSDVDLDDVQLEYGELSEPFSLEADASRSVLIEGLRADTEITFEIVGAGFDTEPVDYQTSPLPSGWPDCEVTSYADFAEGEMVCANGWIDDRPMYYCIDRTGEPLWMLSHSEGIEPLAVKHRPAGGWVAVGAFQSKVLTFDEAGGSLTDLSSVWFEGRTRFEQGLIDMHEVIAITEGRWEGAVAVITNVEDIVDGELRKGNGIVVLEPSTHEVLWDWSVHGELGDNEPIDPALDYWRAGRGAGADSEDDWTHANALIHLVQDDGSEQFLVSLRRQDWIIAVDVDTDGVLWRLGDKGDFELTEGEWYFQQHAPELQWHDEGAGELVVYDNGLNRPGATEDYSRVVSIEYDTETWTARQTAEVGGFYAHSRGDADVLPGGDRLQYLVGSDDTPHVSEVSWPDGELLWEWSCPYVEDGMWYRVSFFPSFDELDWWYEVDR